MLVAGWSNHISPVVLVFGDVGGVSDAGVGVGVGVGNGWLGGVSL